MRPSERRKMIHKEGTDLSPARQCKLLKNSRSSMYDTPVGLDQATIDLMHEIGRIFTQYPCQWKPSDRSLPAPIRVFGGTASGAASHADHGGTAIYKSPNTSKKHPQHPVYPYFLRHLAIARPNHGLGNTKSAVVAAVQHAGCQILC